MGQENGERNTSHFIYGFHAVVGRLRQQADSVTELYVDRGRRDPRVRDLLQLAAPHAIRILWVPRERLDGMTGSHKHQGVVAAVASRAAAPVLDVDDIMASIDGDALLLVLDGVKDPHNLGACLRVADAFGVHAVVAPKDRAAPLTPAARKVASGAADTVPFVTVTNLARVLRTLKAHGVWVVGAVGEAEDDLLATRLQGPVAWVMGAEEEGLRRLTREICDQVVRIPMVGTVESLNVSVAAGVCLFETYRQRNASSNT